MIKIVQNPFRDGLIDTSAYSNAATKKIRAFHASLPVYNQTPLVKLDNLKNIRAVYIKNESYRFGLKSFKALGGVWAVYNLISQYLGLINPSVNEILAHRDEISNLTFVTTTDGNHGKGISWAAGLFSCKSIVFMPKNSAQARAQAIQDAGTAKVTITDMNYDDCVKFSAQFAADNDFFLVQDTSWANYEQIPAQIMLGYSTLAYEAINQMNFKPPTHIFLQAGVGSMAAAVAAVFNENFHCPRITIVEPTEVAGFYESFRVADGKIHSATGNLQTIMAGLNCATPCELAWNILSHIATDSAIISDSDAVNAMKFLANHNIIAGESGCAAFALALAAINNKNLHQQLQLDEDSIIFVVNTEGDTDPFNYQKILNQKEVSS